MYLELNSSLLLHEYTYKQSNKTIDEFERLNMRLFSKDKQTLIE